MFHDAMFINAYQHSYRLHWCGEYRWTVAMTALCVSDSIGHVMMTITCQNAFIEASSKLY